MHLAMKTGFNHGDLKAENVVVSDERTVFKYEGVSVDSPNRYIIADLDKSSISLETSKGILRIYNENPFARKYLWLSPFNPKIGSHYGTSYYVVDSYMTAQIYALSRHMGFPFYSSFDIYTFLMSLFSMPNVHNSLRVSKNLKRIWNSVFFEDEISLSYRKLSKISNMSTRSISHVVSSLKGMKLKCGALETLMETLRSF